ncbi:MAG: hypothetical protein ACPG47_04635, partial [Leucothrix sp.]
EKADEEQVLLAEMDEAKQAEIEQKRKDEQLLATYESREDVIRVFSKKISQIDQSIGILKARDESLTQKLKRLNNKYKQTKDESSRVTLSMQISNAKDSLSEYQKAITMNHVDKKVMTGQYRKTLIRFDHLSASDH